MPGTANNVHATQLYELGRRFRLSIRGNITAHIFVAFVLFYGAIQLTHCLS